MKPKGLKETTTLMGIFNLCGYAFFDPSIGYQAIQLILLTIIIGISYIVLWHYWLGKNWARILVLITSIAALINLGDIQQNNLYAQAIIASEAILAVFLLYWLNTNKIKSFFKENKLPIK